VLHLIFIPRGQDSNALTNMFEYLTHELATTTRSFPGTQKTKNLARACTLDNRTPLVSAVCHPAITENIIQELVNAMQISPDDNAIHFIVNQSPVEWDTFRTQIIMAIAHVARQVFSNYDHLRPIVQVCPLEVCQQLIHFPCRYNNRKLLEWLLKQPLLNSDSATSKNSISILNGRDHAGYTPLLTAVFYGSTNCIEYLLQVSNRC
jgi:hypothetical protein